MHDHQLQELRREKWRLNGQPVRTLEDARSFIESVGFCLLYPQRPPVLAPTFVGAYKGGDEQLPTAQMAFADPVAREAKDLMVRLLREKSAFEANLFPENNFILPASVFPYFYALAGDRTAQMQMRPIARAGYSPLAVHAFDIIQKDGPISKQRLRELVGGEISEAALDRALDELWAKLRITRVDYKQEEGVFWDVLFRWAPKAVKKGIQITVPEAATALVSKYLDCVVAAEQEQVEQFFGKVLPRARVREAVFALQAARELRFVHVGGRVMLQVASLLPAQNELESGSQPRSEPLPPRPGMPLVPRRIRRPAKSVSPKEDTSKK